VASALSLLGRRALWRDNPCISIGFDPLDYVTLITMRSVFRRADLGRDDHYVDQ